VDQVELIQMFVAGEAVFTGKATPILDGAGGRRGKEPDWLAKGSYWMRCLVLPF